MAVWAYGGADGAAAADHGDLPGGSGVSRRQGTKPSTSAVPPESGWRMPASILRVVVFPAPLGPMKPASSPGSDVERDRVDGVDGAIRGAEEGADGGAEAGLTHGGTEIPGEEVGPDGGVHVCYRRSIREAFQCSGVVSRRTYLPVACTTLRRR